jgi:wobble nucleotide-excising tRNase
MIESLQIAKVATYGPIPQPMAALSKLNFIFGMNGAGKTSITRLIESPALYPTSSLVWKNGTPMQAMVYNRDFVERNFNPIAKLKGVFTLGDADPAHIAAVDAKKAELEASTAKLEGWQKTLSGADGKAGMRDELGTLETQLKDKCWEQKKKHDGLFSAAFEGLRGDSAKFKTRVLQELAGNNAPSRTLEYLTDRAKMIFGPAPTIETALAGIGGESLVASESEPILAKSVVGKSDVDIAAMIQRLGNSDWVKQGMEFYHESAPACPFCQQDVISGFKKSLSSYFDESFEQDSKAIADFEAAYQADAFALTQRLAAIQASGSRFVDSETFAADKSAIESKIATNALLIAAKRKEPSQVVKLESLEGALASTRKLISDANAAIGTHNQVVSNITKERRDLTAEVWRYILDVELKKDLASFIPKKAALGAAIASLNKQILDGTAARDAIAVETKTLEKKTTSVQPTITAINALLKSFGFNSFRLAMAEGGPFYRLVRSDATDAQQTLSEGERSFVTFLYFYHLLKGSDSDTGMTNNRVVVVDDPVSSLDSDVLFIVSSLIKLLFEEMRQGKGYIKQIFVLTHNVYFHKEITFVAPRKDGGAKLSRSFWVVRKTDAGSTITRHESNPIKTSYDLLWHEVRRQDRCNLTIQNTLRRILENYFKILGGMDFDDICAKFEGKEKLVCQSLLSWVNDGSHHAHDDLYFTQDAAAIDGYIDVFKRVFIETDQGRHFEMMMAAEG